MENTLQFVNRLKECRTEKKMSQAELADAVGVSRNTISSIETGQYSPTAKLACTLCLVLDKKFEEIFFFEGFQGGTPAHSDEKDEIPSKILSRIMEYLSDKDWNAAQILDLISYLTKQD